MPDGEDVLVVEIPTEGEGEDEMPEPIELPQTIYTPYMAQLVHNHSNIMNESNANVGFANAMLRSIGAKKFDQVGTIEAGAVKTVMEAKPV